MIYKVTSEFVEEFKKLCDHFDLFKSRFDFERTVNEEVVNRELKVPKHYVTVSKFEKTYRFISDVSIRTLLNEINIPLIKFDRRHNNLYFDPADFVLFFENGFFKHRTLIFNKYNLLKDSLPALVKLRKSLPSN